MTTLQQEIDQLKPWFHNIHLPDGTQTAPNHTLGDFPAFKWQDIAPYIPEDLTNWKVLDVGCNAGFYTIELAKRGAQVLAIDIDPHYLKQAAWIAQQFGLEKQIEFRQLQVYDVAHLEQKFDLIWYMGVMYHLRYPLLSLDILSQKLNRLMVFQTLTMPGEEVAEVPQDLDFNDREKMQQDGWPKMAFIEQRLAGDVTNWWAPNHAAIEAMLRSCGLNVMHRPAHEIYLCELDTSNNKSVHSWNKSEYLSATGQNWEEAVQMKVTNKNRTLTS
ncbi:TIGR04290 family methyltransferase [Adhaeribacter radiodurans]|uniref:TIGR04290 family methyltransferase n=1 Tax=Adhaeribacter radiodurans TaxID=2745197 RepID=A0A7L7L9K9_9BACT|nr:TIGR04290 family methyltransferase [Adhaeribacter radiodurans]QMU29215.1 TIGR04290 family methyltransferase [Adhaeribacter radiodurans]